MKRFFWFLLCVIGLGRGPMVCWFSERYFDIHDYKKHKGGDGTPSHFYTYICQWCGKRFEI